ncbi:MAG: AraC family transcriptional regulator [Verrucomicrobiota bacterium JB024]|nr:AraC family transcriptional regulator [Verrucomicrobiota bacterium JB024]
MILKTYTPQQHNVSLQYIYNCLSGFDIANEAGELFLPDASLPTHRTKTGHGWRCMQMPRLHLLLEGEHQFVYLRQSQLKQASLKRGDIWFCPPDSHDYEIFSTQCQYMGVMFHDAYTRFIEVRYDPNKSTAAPTPNWCHWIDERPYAVQRTLEALQEVSHWTTPKATSMRISRQLPPSLSFPGWQSNTHIGRHLALTLFELIRNWIQLSSSTQVPRCKANSSWIIIDRYIQENYHRPINRESASQSLQLHPSRISVLCRQFAGKSFNEILQERRIRQAKRFLENSSSKIDIVATMCGYSGAAYFIRAFRRATGMTPGTWRLTHAS